MPTTASSKASSTGRSRKKYPVTMISQFVGPHEFLATSYPVDVRLDGVIYPSVEHALNAAKTLDPAEREKIREANSPQVATRIGLSVSPRPGWGQLRIPIMRDLLLQKYSFPELADLLLLTDRAELVNGNIHGERFWGVCYGKGGNWTGRLTTNIREQLRATKPSPGRVCGRCNKALHPRWWAVYCSDSCARADA